MKGSAKTSGRKRLSVENRYPESTIVTREAFPERFARALDCVETYGTSMCMSKKK